MVKDKKVMNDDLRQKQTEASKDTVAEMTNNMH
jgi:hypothetical protein